LLIPAQRSGAHLQSAMVMGSDRGVQFRTDLLTEIEFVDKSIGELVSALEEPGLSESTLIILTAKHGQSPIDAKPSFTDSRTFQW
jgi:predicted AlkP superfamily pyrophosphatase or phosphodiesterase